MKPSQRTDISLATVIARKGQMEALAQRLRSRFGIELPRAPRRAVVGDIALLGTSPNTWLAVHEQDGKAFVPALRETLAGLASVSDQSDAYVVFRLSGANVRDALAKLIPIDVHPRVFKVGDVASTVAAHIGAIVWRRDDNPGEAPVFEIAVFRSFVESFEEALTAIDPRVH